MTSVRSSDKTKPYIPLAGTGPRDGFSNEDEATATCFCGAVQLKFPTSKPGLLGSFICNCTDCRKITASMFASNFTIDNRYLVHVRGQDKMKQFSQIETTTTGNRMTNHFCGECGTLLYRIGTGFPGASILRLGTVDDYNLVETKLKPDLEQFIEDRVAWLPGATGIKQVERFAYHDAAMKGKKAALAAGKL
ncbi:hypothetical protein T439DRAFT_383228 [Meredithblackwellia eburnea MCA 4105]